MQEALEITPQVLPFSFNRHNKCECSVKSVRGVPLLPCAGYDCMI